MTFRPNFNIFTFGCKLNQAESCQIAADLMQKKFPLAKREIYFIINACAVTHKAVREVRQKVTQLKRDNPKAKIIVAGCLAEKNWPAVDLWVENKDKHKTAKIIKERFFNQKSASEWSSPYVQLSLRTRAFVKIQSGCDNYCSYCIVPFTRGHSSCVSPTKIINEIREKEKAGYKEVVLTGVNIGLYLWSANLGLKERADNKVLELTDLLRLILEKTQIQRIRLGSLWPTHLKQRLINLFATNSRFCAHLHLSIQSGSNQILKLMGRNYRCEDVLQVVRRCRSKIPLINFTADMLVGFPGETDKDFKDSRRLIEKIGFSKVHVFKYSVRPGTAAAKMRNQLPEMIKQQRSRELIERAELVATKIKKKFLNKKMPVLWEYKLNGYWYGFTDNYIRVKKKVNKNENLRDKIEEIKLKEFV